MEIKLNIQSYAEREKIMSALANSGYAVWVEQLKHPYTITDIYLVCFNYTPSEETIQTKDTKTTL